MDNIVGEYQSGFRKGRGVVDQIFTLREIQAESHEHQKNTYLLFVDFKQAYDKVKRLGLYKALQELEVNPKLIRMVKMTLHKTENTVKVRGQYSQKFECLAGLRQGDPTSAVLFNFVLEKVIRDAHLNRTGLILHKKHQCIAFADDLVLITRSKHELQNIVKRLEETARRMGLEINEEKTKYMTWTEKEFGIGHKLEITTAEGRVYCFEEVDKFTYLGTIFGRKPGSTDEIQARMLSGNRCIYALNRLLKSKQISRSLKVHLYKTIIRPIVTFASEIWTLKKTDQNLLEVWERKVLRKIFGGKQVNGIWERRSNQELKDLFQETNIIGVVRAQRIRWLGHILRMQQGRTPKAVLDHSLGGKKRRGRPRERWKKEVEDDLRKLNITGWNNKAQNKKQWKNIVTQAMGLLGS